MEQKTNRRKGVLSMMDPVEAFARQLRRFRREAGLTQRELGEILAYSPKAVSKWESGRALPPSHLMVALARALHTDLNSLFDCPEEPQFYLGIDGGGTKTDFALADGDGRLLRRLTKGPCNPTAQGVDSALELLESGIFEVIGAIPPEQISVFAGMAGGSGEPGRVLTERLQHRGFARVQAGGDYRNAVVAGLQGRDGLVVIMGTGSSVFSVKEGKVSRVGGYWYLFGDEGSGYAVGRDGVRAVLAAQDGSGLQTEITGLWQSEIGMGVWEYLPELYRQGRTAIAGLARLVVRAAEQGDGVARQILEQNMAAVAHYIRAALPEDRMAPIPAVLVGGFVTASYRLLRPMLDKHIGDDRVELSLLECRPVWGALLLAGMPAYGKENSGDAENRDA